MKISIINTPMRGVPDTFPPYGSLCLVQYLKKRGITNVEFINVDYFRYSVDEVLDKLINNGTKILGISAVTSTAYTYSKEISLKFKEKKPNSLIVLGGNLAASAEIVLKKTGVDFCALGEGEIIFYNLVKRAQETKNISDFKDIPGLAYIDESGEVVNTGYEEKLDSAEMYDADWSDLFKDNTADHYIQDVFDKDGNLLLSHFQHDKRTFESHRKGKKFFTFIIGKGCVARCTFCHRWGKGIRYVPIDELMARLDNLIEKYNIGFISPFVESFGNDKKWLDKFYIEIKKRDILWYSGAVRARTVSPEIIDQMKDSGCASLYYGLETGSERMLSIMEKKTTLQDNRNAQQWTVNAGFYSTIIQFIIGMPGESPETINETLEFSKWAYTLNENLNPLIFSINYAQALPGTPLYEYGRKLKLIGRDIDSEEEYLIFVSDRDAADVGSVVNFTDYPMAVLLSWKHILYFGTIVAYVKKYGIKQLIKVNSKSGDLKTRKLTKYNDFIFNFKTYRRVLVYTILYKFKSILPFIVLYKYRKRIGNKRTIKFLWELLKYVLSFGVKKDTKIELNKSLRKIVDNEMDIIDTDIPQMAPLRKGR